MKPLKFVLPVAILLCSLTVFAQVEKSLVPPAPPEQPVQPPLPPPPPPSLHLKINKQHSKQFKILKKGQVPKQPEKPLPPPPPPVLPKER